MAIKLFYFFRLRAIIFKEVSQLIRDRVVFFSLILIPLIEVFLLGIVTNSDPKHIPTAVVNYDYSYFSERLITNLKNTHYFDITHVVANEDEANQLLKKGIVQFAVIIPLSFSHDLIRGNHPQVLLEADTSNPMTVSNGIQAAKAVAQDFFVNASPSFTNLSAKASALPFDFNIVQKYNPAAIPQFSTVPGVIGLTLAMNMLMFMLVSITREREEGTIEMLLTTPTTAFEVLLGKITPFAVISYLQLLLMVILSTKVFKVAFLGSEFLLLVVAFPFIVATLMSGLLISCISKNQLQAMNIANAFSLVNILFSGFLYPFQALPVWGKWVGHALPLTNFLNITRGIMLKDCSFFDIWGSLWPMLVFMLVVTMIATKSYKNRLG